MKNKLKCLLFVFIVVFLFGITNVNAEEVAVVNGITCSSITEAINKTPNNTETTIKLLMDFSESITFSNKKNIILDLNGHTLSMTDDLPLITNSGKLVITNGTMTSSADTKGMINNNSGAKLTINDGTFIASGYRQVIYNNGGTVNISGSAKLTSSADERSTIHNLGNGTVNITGGTIKSTGCYALYNAKGTINIGTKDDAFNINTPIIQGKNYGVVAKEKINFYDGVIRGGTYHIGKTNDTNNTPNISNDNNETKINELEENAVKYVDDEDIDGVLYKYIYCTINNSSIRVTFDPNGGEVDPTYKLINAGDEVGELPTPVRDEYTFDGWYTEPDGGDQISASTTVSDEVTYYAHWTEAPDVAWIGTTGYKSLYKATLAAVSGDTIILGEGEYSLYSTSSNASTDKDLTFVGQGPDKTKWYIGAKVPQGGESPTYNVDYSFKTAGKITFKDMTLQTGKADYLGFAQLNNSVYDNCVINGKIEYQSYESATYTNSTFNCPNNDYCLWTYSSPSLTFDNCTFNSSGKTINVYSNASNIGSKDIVINFKDCTVNSTNTVKNKTVMNINDSDRVSKNNYFIINFLGNNTINGIDFSTLNKDYIKLSKDVTCTRLFEFNTKPGTNGNSGHTIININGTKVWENGEVQDYETLTEYEGEIDYVRTIGDWKLDDSGEFYKRTLTKRCDYCNHTFTSIEKGGIVTYTDGVDDEVIFEDQVSEILSEKEDTPKFNGGRPKRTGYFFKGWDKTISEKVTRNVTYTAQWEKINTINPKTNDNILLYVLMLEISVLGFIGVNIYNKKIDM